MRESNIEINILNDTCTSILFYFIFYICMCLMCIDVHDIQFVVAIILLSSYQFTFTFQLLPCIWTLYFYCSPFRVYWEFEKHFVYGMVVSWKFIHVYHVISSVWFIFPNVLIMCLRRLVETKMNKRKKHTHTTKDLITIWLCHTIKVQNISKLYTDIFYMLHNSHMKLFYAFYSWVLSFLLFLFVLLLFFSYSTNQKLLLSIILWLCTLCVCVDSTVVANVYWIGDICRSIVLANEQSKK